MSFQYKCIFCPETFPNIEKVQNHLEKYHNVPTGKHQDKFQKLFEKLDHDESRGSSWRKREAAEAKPDVIKKPKLDLTNVEESKIPNGLCIKAEPVDDGSKGDHEEGTEKDLKLGQRIAFKTKKKPGFRLGPKSKIQGQVAKKKCAILSNSLRDIGSRNAVVKLQRLSVNRNIAELNGLAVQMSSATDETETSPWGANIKKGANLDNYCFKKAYSKWVNQCELSCQGCSFKCKGRKTMNRHVQLKHGNGQTYKTKKIVLHKCLVCHRSIMHKLESLHSHFKHCSNLGAKEYFKRFIIGENSSVGEEEMQSGVAEISESTKREEKKNLATSDELQTPASVSLKKKLSNWANQCEYSCQTCIFKCKSGNTMCKHIKTKHIIGSKKVKIVKHRCFICKSMVTHDSRNLHEHLRRRHYLSTRDYFKRFILGERETDGKLKPSEVEGSTNDTARKHNSYSDTEYSHWADQCEYSCSSCNFETKKKNTIRLHMKVKHGQGQTYRNKKIVYHKCLVCHKSITHNWKNLHNHFKRCQNLGPREYFEKFILPSNQFKWVFWGSWENCSRETLYQINFYCKTKPVLTLTSFLPCYIGIYFYK